MDYWSGLLGRILESPRVMLQEAAGFLYLVYLWRKAGLSEPIAEGDVAAGRNRRNLNPASLRISPSGRSNVDAMSWIKISVVCLALVASACGERRTGRLDFGCRSR